MMVSLARSTSFQRSVLLTRYVFPCHQSQDPAPHRRVQYALDDKRGERCTRRKMTRPFVVATGSPSYHMQPRCNKTVLVSAVHFNSDQAASSAPGVGAKGEGRALSSVTLSVSESARRRAR